MIGKLSRSVLILLATTVLSCSNRPQDRGRVIPFHVVVSNLEESSFKEPLNFDTSSVPFEELTKQQDGFHSVTIRHEGIVMISAEAIFVATSNADKVDSGYGHVRYPIAVPQAQEHREPGQFRRGGVTFRTDSGVKLEFGSRSTIDKRIVETELGRVLVLKFSGSSWSRQHTPAGGP